MDHVTTRRWVASLAMVATAGIHAALVPAHLHEAPYAGGLFIALSIATLVNGLALLGSDHRLVWRATAGLACGAVGAYVVSRSVGLPALGDDVGDWLNPLGVAAVVCETVAAATASRALAGERRPVQPVRAAGVN